MQNAEFSESASALDDEQPLFLAGLKISEYLGAEALQADTPDLENS